jgi:hypothetical protein
VSAHFDLAKAQPERFFGYRVHPCGCETVFDLDAWRSRTIVLCNAHSAVISRHGAG